ncbi:MAG: hypothetical protein ACXVHX_39115 [Solirubrobacteraceae bacterium]
MSETSDLDTALIRVHRVEMEADARNDEAKVNACQVVLDALLEERASLPLQRVCAEIPAFRTVTPKQ